MRQRKQAGMKRASQVLVRRAMCQVRVPVFKFSCFFFPSLFDALFIRKKPTTINFDFSTQVPLTLSPVTGRRLDYTIFSGDIGVTD